MNLDFVTVKLSRLKEKEMEKTKSFAQRIELFWDWFLTNEEKLSDFVENRDKYEGDDIVDFITEGIGLISDSICFNVGGNYEFTFTIGGSDHLFYLFPHLVATVPESLKDKWTFFPCMQGTQGISFGFGMYGVTTDTDQIQVSFTVSEENKADIRFYQKELAGLTEKECYDAFYIVMENCIGEALAHTCIGNVQLASNAEEDMFSLTELQGKLKDAFCKDGHVADPADMNFTYQLKPKEDYAHLREDVFIGTGNNAVLINAYYDEEVERYQDFTELGAKPVFLFYCYDKNVEGKAALNERYDIMDSLEEIVLLPRGSANEIGIMLGGAMGQSFAYIDMILFNPAEFMEKVGLVLRNYPYLFCLSEFKSEGDIILLNCDDASDLARKMQFVHENNGHLQIVKAYEALDKAEHDYALTGYYGRALNNVERYEDALHVLQSQKDVGEKDAVWHYRVGYSLYYLDRDSEAAEHFKRSIEIGGPDEEAQYFLDDCLKRIH